MKKQIMYAFSILPLLFVVDTAFSQAGGQNLGIDKNTLSSYAESLVANETAIALEELKASNNKVFRNFTKKTKNASEVRVSSNNGFTFISCKVDGIVNRIGYDKKGNWHHALRFLSEDQLPKEVRHEVRSRYYDFSIACATEVQFDRKTAYVISLQDKNTWMKLKVVDGEIEIMGKFRKS